MKGKEKPWRKCKCVLLSTSSQIKKAIYCDSNCNIFWNKQNYSESTKMSGYKERMRRRSTEDF